MIVTAINPEVGHLHLLGQNAIAQLAAMTGGKSYFLRLRAPVSFRSYLDNFGGTSTTPALEGRRDEQLRDTFAA